MKSIFITGAASGIGKETARKFVGEGWRVGLADLNSDSLQALNQELGTASSLYVADVRDPTAIGEALKSFCGTPGNLDAFFNCAGILEMRSFSETPLARLRDIIDVNMIGTINCIHTAIPYLIGTGNPKIVNMSSVSAVYGIPEEAVYSASKFGVRGLTEALNIELEPLGIWVCDVMVAYVATPMVLEAEEQARSVGILGVNVMPRQVAEIVHAAMSERKVHWFVTEADEAVASQVDAAGWQERRAIVKAISGF